MFTKKYFEEFQIGQTRSTIGRTITETDIVMHAGQTGDFFPHHMDAEWCKDQPFKQRIAHGTLIFSIAIGMTASFINEVAMTYGYERLRFVRPVYIGDTLTVHIDITDKQPYKKPGYGMVTEKVEVLNQKDQTVMVCEHLLLTEKRDS